MFGDLNPEVSALSTDATFPLNNGLLPNSSAAEYGK
jgi:hypothetical protein